VDRASIWDDLQAQSLLGAEGFAEGAAPSCERKSRVNPGFASLRPQRLAEAYEILWDDADEAAAWAVYVGDK
jgi:hypothetical protein